MSTLGVALDPLTPASTDTTRREAAANRERHSSLIRLFRNAMHAEPGTARMREAEIEPEGAATSANPLHSPVRVRPELARRSST